MQKKVLLLMAGLLRPNPHPPSSLKAVGTLGKKGSKKLILMARFFTPPPLNGPAIKRRTFFYPQGQVVEQLKNKIFLIKVSLNSRCIFSLLLRCANAIKCQINTNTDNKYGFRLPTYLKGVLKYSY